MCRSLCPTDDEGSRRACQFRRHRRTCRGEGIAHNCVFGSTVTGPEHVRPDIACFDLHLRRDERDLNPHGRAANDRPARATQAGCCRPTQCRPEPHAVDRTVWIVLDVLDVLDEERKLPFRRVGNRRRVLLADLLAYKRVDDAERRAIADELTGEAQRIGLDY
jgi:hypothetical protein